MSQNTHVLLAKSKKNIRKIRMKKDFLHAQNVGTFSIAALLVSRSIGLSTRKNVIAFSQQELYV